MCQVAAYSHYRTSSSAVPGLTRRAVVAAVVAQELQQHGEGLSV